GRSSGCRSETTAPSDRVRVPPRRCTRANRIRDCGGRAWHAACRPSRASAPIAGDFGCTRPRRACRSPLRCARINRPTLLVGFYVQQILITTIKPSHVPATIEHAHDNISGKTPDERIADWTEALAWFTLLLATISVIQIGFFDTCRQNRSYHRRGGQQSCSSCG